MRQTVAIVPVPELKPERDVIRGKPVAPDRLDTHYVKHSVTAEGDGTEHHVVSGMTLVIGGPDDRKELHRMFHMDRSSSKMPADQATASRFKTLTLCADHLVIHDELSMPETDVNIYDSLEEQLAIPLGFQDWDRSAQRKSGNLSISRNPAYHSTPSRSSRAAMSTHWRTLIVPSRHSCTMKALGKAASFGMVHPSSRDWHGGKS